MGNGNKTIPKTPMTKGAGGKSPVKKGGKGKGC